MVTYYVKGSYVHAAHTLYNQLHHVHLLFNSHVFYMTSVKKFKGSEIKNESGIGPSPRKVR